MFFSLTIICKTPSSHFLCSLSPELTTHHSLSPPPSADEVRAAAAAEARLSDEQRGYRAAGASPLGVQGPADRGSQVSPDA